MNSTDFHLSNSPQLFIDNIIIECTQGLTRRWHIPKRFGDKPLISRDRPWEQTLYFTYSNHIVLKDPDDGKIKCWYEDLGPITGKGHPLKTRLLYAESDDGIVFRKPELDICSFNGNPTNIVMGYFGNNESSEWNIWAQDGVHSNGILLDPNPSCPDEKFRTIFTRYKIGQGPKNKDDLYDAVKAGHSIECAHSRDGIHWISYDSKPVLGGSSSMLDDVSCLHYDSHAEVFVQNTRHYKMKDVSLPPLTPRVSQWFAPYYPLRPDLMNKRRVFQTRSKDFLTWGDLIPISVPDDETDNLDEAHYGMQQFRIGDIHFATLGILKYVDNEMEVRLLFSRDGKNFSPVNRAEPFLAPRGPNYWDAYMVSITSPPIEIGDEWFFYHGGSSCHHDWWITGLKEGIDSPEAYDPKGHANFGLGLARIRKEGFASLEGTRERKGYLITRPIQYDGSSLYINAKCGIAGSIRAEIRDLENRPIEGYTLDNSIPFTSDSTRHELKWENRNTIPNLGWYKLLFLIDDAQIFSFKIL